MHRETSAQTGHRLSSFADGSDCPTIDPDGECCRYIGQALPDLTLVFLIFSWFTLSCLGLLYLGLPDLALIFLIFSWFSLLCLGLPYLGLPYIGLPTL